MFFGHLTFGAFVGVLEGGGGRLVEIGDRPRVGGTARIVQARALRDDICFRSEHSLLHLRNCHCRENISIYKILVCI